MRRSCAAGMSYIYLQWLLLRSIYTWSSISLWREFASLDILGFASCGWVEARHLYTGWQPLGRRGWDTYSKAGTLTVDTSELSYWCRIGTLFLHSLYAHTLNIRFPWHHPTPESTWGHSLCIRERREGRIAGVTRICRLTCFLISVVHGVKTARHSEQCLEIWRISKKTYLNIIRILRAGKGRTDIKPACTSEVPVKGNAILWFLSRYTWWDFC